MGNNVVHIAAPEPLKPLLKEKGQHLVIGTAQLIETKLQDWDPSHFDEVAIFGDQYPHRIWTRWCIEAKDSPHYKYFRVVQVNGVWYAVVNDRDTRQFSKLFSFLYFKSPHQWIMHHLRYTNTYSDPVCIYQNGAVWKTHNVSYRQTEIIISCLIIKNRYEKTWDDLSDKLKIEKEWQITYVPNSHPNAEPYIIPLLYQHSIYAISTYKDQVIYRMIESADEMEQIEPGSTKLIILPMSEKIHSFLMDQLKDVPAI